MLKNNNKTKMMTILLVHPDNCHSGTSCRVNDDLPVKPCNQMMTMLMMMIFVIDDDEPWHRQHVTIVKVDIDHFPIYILQLTHLMITGHFRHLFAFVVFAEKNDFKIHDYEMEGKFYN